MSEQDTKRLGNVISNVFREVACATSAKASNDDMWTAIYAAQIKATGIIVAALINNSEDCYHDYE